MISGYGQVLGIAKIELKIVKITKEVIIFIMDGDKFEHDFLIGLDLIRAFFLRQDEKSENFSETEAMV